jgi:DNA phosphorothioation-associated putative methyltransferase
VLYVFKDEALSEQFRASRFRRPSVALRKRLSEQRFEENRDLLEPLMAAIGDLGRLPLPNEFAQAPEVIDRFGSLKRAFALIWRVTGPAEGEAIRRRRREDLLVYLALDRFGKRPAFYQLARSLQVDMRAFFGAYT